MRDRERWQDLEDAWAEMLAEATPDGCSVGHVLDAWPDRKRGPALAWVDAQIAAGRGPRRWTSWSWLELLTDRDDVDPRARLVDTIDVDHAEWTPAQVTRLLRFAPQLVMICIQECGIDGGPEALFPPGVAWPRLRELYIEDDDFGLSETLIDRVVSATWLGQLEVLRLDGCDPAAVDRLAASAMPCVQTLELGVDGEVTAAQVAALLDDRRRPRLEALELYRSTPPTDALTRAGVAVRYRS